MSNLKSIKFFELLASKVLIVLECGHICINDEVPSDETIQCEKCSNGDDYEYNFFIPNTPSKIKSKISDFKNKISDFYIDLSKLDSYFAEIVGIYRDKIGDTKQSNYICYNIQNKFLALGYDLITSSELFIEGYLKGLYEIRKESYLRNEIFSKEKSVLISPPNSIPIIYSTIQKQHNPIKENMITKLIDNPCQIYGLIRIKSLSKSLLFQIRAFQDICAKIIIFLKNEKIGEKTSMSAVTRKGSSINSFILANLDDFKEYISWFETSKEIRDSIKTGNWLSDATIEDYEIKIFRQKDQDTEIKLDIEYFKTSIENSHKLVKMLIKAIEEYIKLSNLIFKNIFLSFLIKNPQ